MRRASGQRGRVSIKSTKEDDLQRGNKVPHELLGLSARGMVW